MLRICATACAATATARSFARKYRRAARALAGVFTVGYNFAVVYNLQPKGEPMLIRAVRSLLRSGVFANRHRYRSGRIGAARRGSVTDIQSNIESRPQKEQRKPHLNMLTVSGIALLKNVPVGRKTVRPAATAVAAGKPTARLLAQAALDKG